MKCYEMQQVENPIEWGLYYDKSEVDAAIAELKAENRKLKQEIERLKQENKMSLIGVNLHSPTSDGRLV